MFLHRGSGVTTLSTCSSELCEQDAWVWVKLETLTPFLTMYTSNYGGFCKGYVVSHISIFEMPSTSKREMKELQYIVNIFS